MCFICLQTHESISENRGMIAVSYMIKHCQLFSNILDIYLSRADFVTLVFII